MKGKCLILALALLLLFLSAVGLAAGQHEAIVISGPEDLTPANGVVGGSGTKADPFVIGGWKIDGSETGFGIEISDVAAYISIKVVSVQSASRVGIEINGSPHVVLEDCEFLNDEVGLSLRDLSEARVRGNRFIACTGVGIRISSCRNGILSGNEFSGRNSGIVVMDGSTSNRIVENSFRGRAFVSLYLGSGGNWIYHNNFFQAVVMDSGYNVWDDGKEGNFWGKQYHGRDRNHDGFGDTPHKIQGGYNYDRHPLMSPWER